MVKPRLPEQIEEQLPEDVIKYIYRYVPHLDKIKTPTTSPSLERELKRIQIKTLQGKSTMYMKELEDFILEM
jgi:hypothetical protein